jgi:hypothetical protein
LKKRYEEEERQLLASRYEQRHDTELRKDLLHALVRARQPRNLHRSLLPRRFIAALIFQLRGVVVVPMNVGFRTRLAPIEIMENYI